MQCTCYLGVCQPHERLDPPPRQALSPAEVRIMQRHEANDWPDDKRRYSSEETRLLVGAWFKVGRLSRGVG